MAADDQGYAGVSLQHCCLVVEALARNAHEANERIVALERRVQSLQMRVDQLETNEQFWRSTLDWVWNTFHNSIKVFYKKGWWKDRTQALEGDIEVEEVGGVP